MNNAEHVLKSSSGRRPITPEPVMLDRRNTTPNAELNPTISEIVYDAQVLNYANGMVEGEHFHQWCHTNCAGELGGRSDEHLLVWHHAEIGAMVLCQIITRETCLIGHADEIEPVLQ